MAKTNDLESTCECIIAAVTSAILEIEAHQTEDLDSCYLKAAVISSLATDIIQKLEKLEKQEGEKK